jgi:acetate kinase
LRLDLTANMAAAAVISSKQSQVSVRIIRTDEESVIAAETARLLGMSDTGEAACSPTQ